MPIYTSDKAVPYVYICTHKETDQFYIGYRMVNNTPSHLDLPKYKTSSKIVKPNFLDYTWTIIAEFFDPSDAYTFEQQLICDNWGDPLLLNKHYAKDGHKQFRVSGPNGKKGEKRGPHSAERKQNIRAAKIGVPTGRKGIPTGQIPWNKGIPHSDETKKKQHDAMVSKPGTPHSEETKDKMRKPKGKQKLVECPHCSLVGGISNMKRRHFDNCSKKPI